MLRLCHTLSRNGVTLGAQVPVQRGLYAEEDETRPGEDNGEEEEEDDDDVEEGDSDDGEEEEGDDEEAEGEGGFQKTQNTRQHFRRSL